MELKKRGYLVRWAYLFDPSFRIPDQTSLCAIFWRCVLWTPLMLIAIVLLGATLMYVLSRAWRGVLLVVGCVAGGIGGIYLIVQLFDWLDGGSSLFQRFKTDRLARSVLWQGAIAVKSKFCPVVQLRD